MKKKMFVMFLVSCLMLISMACGTKTNNQEVKNEEVEVSEGDFGDLVKLISDESEDSEKEVNTSTSASSYEGSLNGITYRVLSARPLDASEYACEYTDCKGVLVNMVIQNDSEAVISNSTLMSFSFYDEQHDSQSGIELFENVTDSSVDGVIGPGKVLCGEYVLVVDQDTELVTLEITPDLWSDDMAVLTFGVDSVNDQSEYISGTNGNGFGTEFDDEQLSYTVNDAYTTVEEDQTLLTVKMLVQNKGSEESSTYEIPFRVVDEQGKECKMHYSVNSDLLCYIPAGGDQEVEVTFVLKNPESKELELYFVPLGKLEIWDFAHLKLN